MSEIKEKFDEIMGDLKGRIRNPLILSFILVWLYYYWPIILILFDNSLSSSAKTLGITKITSVEGWWGMLGKPVCFAFTSLFAYYMISVIAQLIKIMGRRMNVKMLLNFDKGNYVLKSEYEIQKTKLKKMSDELVKSNSIIIGFNDEKKDLEKEAHDSKIEFGKQLAINNELSENMQASAKFLERFRHTLLFLLAKTKKITTPAVTQEILKDHYRPINGNWQTFSGNHISSQTGLSKYYFIKEDEVSNMEGKPYGKISELSYDKKNLIISFKMYVASQTATHQLHLVRTGIDEWIGFEEGNYIQFIRLEE